MSSPDFPATAFPVRSLEITIRPREQAQRPSAPGALHFVLLARDRSWQLSGDLHNQIDGQRLAKATGQEVTFCVGDHSESATSTPPYVNATVVHVDPRRSTLRVLTSITGLPPVFLLRDLPESHLSSPFMPAAGRGRVHPDLDGVADTLRWGHPIDGRTIFANLSVSAPRQEIIVGPEGNLSVRPHFGSVLDPALLSSSREELICQQIETFAHAARRLPAQGAFLSLTGGLDSRTSLVGLIANGNRPFCVTMAGSHHSLDLRLAADVCRAYGLTHHPVILDAGFSRQLPDLMLEAARLTGGVASLSQTADLFLYRTIGSEFTARVSGNLGNQVGRGGVESLSAYSPLPSAFSAEIQNRLLARPLAPWFIERLQGDDYADVLFSQEVPYWSTGNYAIGSSRALQLTPYADRRLLQLAAAAFALNPELRRPTWKDMRKRDLRHRLYGTPQLYSFQRRFLIEHGAAVRHVPLNWGWFAAGGRSLRFSASAMLSAIDAASLKVSRSGGPLQRTSGWVSARLDHRSSLADWPSLLKTELRQLVRDTLSSRKLGEMGLFDQHGLDSILTEHFSGAASHHRTVLSCLEIALAFATRSA
jgi:hypothetical protein